LWLPWLPLTHCDDDESETDSGQESEDERLDLLLQVSEDALKDTQLKADDEKSTKLLEWNSWKALNPQCGEDIELFKQLPEWTRLSAVVKLEDPSLNSGAIEMIVLRRWVENK
jgi:hypothetical protein